MEGYINGTSAVKIIQFPKKEENIKVVEPQPEKKGNYKVGEKQEVYPFRKEEDLQKMHNYFVEHKQYRDDLMFVVGVNVGLRAGDLLSLKWGQVFDDNGEIVNGITIKEEKTGKFRTFYLNNACKNAIIGYYDILMCEYETKIAKYEKKRKSYRSISNSYMELTEKIENLQSECENIRDEYIFKSNKGGYVDVRPAGLILKKAAKAVGIKYNVGTHSMRKTFGYWQLQAHADDAIFLCELQEMFNHSSPKITLRYCGLESEKMEGYYNDVNLLLDDTAEKEVRNCV